MPFEQSTQGGTAKVPPIPKMETNMPAAPTREQVRKAARQARDDVREAVKQAAQAVKDAAQTGAPVLAREVGQGIPTTLPPPIFPRDVIPPAAVDITMAFFMTVAVCVIGFPLARAIARRIDRRSEHAQVSGPDLTPQLRQLQESVDAMAIELERISEGQRFASKLLAERSGAPRLERQGQG